MGGGGRRQRKFRSDSAVDLKDAPQRLALIANSVEMSRLVGLVRFLESDEFTQARGTRPVRRAHARLLPRTPSPHWSAGPSGRCLRHGEIGQLAPRCGRESRLRARWPAKLSAQTPPAAAGAVISVLAALIFHPAFQQRFKDFHVSMRLIAMACKDGCAHGSCGPSPSAARSRCDADVQSCSSRR